jgi:anti-sigma factor RsiW
MLCMHMDDELDARTQTAVRAHLRTCQHCTDRLQALRADALRLARALPAAPVATVRRPDCYSAEALSAYASGILTPQEDTACEQHLLTCDVCLHEVMAIRGTLALLQPNALATPPAHLVAAVQRRLAPPQPVVEKLGTLVLQLARNGVEFVEALLLPEHVRLAIGGQLVPAGALRSTPEVNRTVALLDIRQSVADLDLRLRVLQEDADTVQLAIQLTRQQQPLGRKRVALIRQGRVLHSQPTTASGEVTFARLTPGEYTVRIPPENLETAIVLRAAAGQTPTA